MDGWDPFKGLTSIIIAMAVFLPFGIWKLVEVVIWLFKNVSIAIK